MHKRKSTTTNLIVMDGVAGTACEARAVSKMLDREFKVLLKHTREILEEGVSDYMVPEQLTSDPAELLYLRGFMLDPTRQSDVALNRHLPVPDIVDIYNSKYLHLEISHQIVVSLQIRSYWGWMTYFTATQLEDVHLLESIAVRQNGDAKEFCDSLWEHMTDGAAMFKPGHVEVTGIDPSTGDKIDIDAETPEGSATARNMLWLQSLVAGLASMEPIELGFMNENPLFRTGMLQMKADIVFLEWLLGDCKDY